MRILALDTTNRSGSVALLDDDRVVDERLGDPARTHAERLPHELVAVAAAHGLTPADIDLFAVASGPGSFTGLRIGIATIQGLAFACGRRIVGISALDALAHLAAAGANPGTHVAPWIDAYRGEVFSALYRVDAPPPFDLGRLSPLAGPHVAAPDATLDSCVREAARASMVFVGDGAVRFADAIRGRLPDARLAGAPAIAGAVGRLALRHAHRGETLDPAGIQPLYVRRPDAEAARERAIQP